ncbi:hypothetical protein BJX61DRAFT_538630 [Aspergillus egyptiacus]|nr:hypothetical protein BJX61DRAFT_538630 [Aspergillus egyptiacus]
MTMDAFTVQTKPQPQENPPSMLPTPPETPKPRRKQRIKRKRLPRDPETPASSLSTTLSSFNFSPNAPCVHPACTPASSPSRTTAPNRTGSTPSPTPPTETLTRSGGARENTPNRPGMPSSAPGQVPGSGIASGTVDRGISVSVSGSVSSSSSKNKWGLTISRRPDRFLLPVQVKLLEYIRRRKKVPIKGLFYNVDQRRKGKDRCLYYTMRWVRKTVGFGDWPFQGFDEEGSSLDLRTRGCARVTLF